MISLIVAMANGNVIGNSNDLPWYLPADLQHFKELTQGKTVIMGRNTCDSIIARLGHGLPHRTNIVITQEDTYQAEGVQVLHSLSEALQREDNTELMVIGGAQIFQQTLGVADRIYMTQIDADIEGDTYFPTVKQDDWQEVNRESHVKDDHNAYNYDFVTLDRVK